METERKELEKGRVEAELKSLKNQLNPHFLFKTHAKYTKINAAPP